jgi:ubiquinone/menaquinone biosynthesis C-methylase UbiE
MILNDVLAVNSADIERKPYTHAMPDYSVDGMTILDVGCATGEHFTHPHYTKAAALYGIDVDEEAVRQGAVRYPHMRLCVGKAEELPWNDEMFDLVVSRVTLPLTNIPVALGEIRRVLKPGGLAYLAMHDVHHQTHWLRGAVKARAVKRVVDMALYVFPASVLFNLTGLCVGRPWNGLFETFQTTTRMTKSLESAGFSQVTYKYINRRNDGTAKDIDRHLIFEARR